jgi:hypothetical protein
MGLLKKDWDGNVYGNSMARLYEEINDWENVERVCREIIESHPVCAEIYWRDLVLTYKETLDWHGQLAVCLEAIQKDPEYADNDNYEGMITTLRGDFRDLQLWIQR